jgi:cytidine deaminase
MSTETNQDLIDRAAEVINERKVGHAKYGQVASALITQTGAMYRGVTIDTPCDGFCAEHAAVAAMITAGESRITTIVAVWNNSDGRLHVLPPCGRCREFLCQINPENQDTDVILGASDVVKLRDLLPYSDTFASEPVVKEHER